jgi:hypothetical protein
MFHPSYFFIFIFILMKEPVHIFFSLLFYFFKLFVLISYYLVFTCLAFGFDYDLVSIFFLL